jgi:DNA primase
MRLLVAHPILAAELDAPAMDAVAQCAPDYIDMLAQLAAAGRDLGAQASFAALTEHLRAAGPDFEPLIAEIAAEAETEVDVARMELAGAVRQTKMKVLKLQLDQLASAGLQHEEARVRYRDLMLQQEQLRRQAEAENASR